VLGNLAADSMFIATNPPGLAAEPVVLAQTSSADQRDRRTRSTSTSKYWTPRNYPCTFLPSAERFRKAAGDI
jgi:hypothetical protein